MHRKATIQAAGVLAACLGLPVAGAAWAGHDLTPLMRFPPPLAIPGDYPRFSWWAAGLVLGVGGWIAVAWVRRWTRTRRHPPAARAAEAGRRHFPWWGWAAAGWTLAWWGLAWTRLPWFAWGQRYTFTPLWLGFVAVANALTWRRGGDPLMIRRPDLWLRLFAGSALFWWVFEWLNRFVNNWHYLGVSGVGPWEYAVHSTVCFATVLPAVTAAREWLGTCGRLQARLRDGPAWPWVVGRRSGVLCLMAGGAGLVLTGAQPVYCYPALWAAPLLIGMGWLVVTEADGWWRGLAVGDWREAGSWALAALGCGGCWELWNWHSLAKWIYTVPFVQRWPIFEMPLLGYSGYLTFGLECALVVRWILGGDAGAPERRPPEPSRR